MMRGLLRPIAKGALIACAAAVVFTAAPAAAQGSYSPYNETATAALTRYLHTLASDPKDFASLIGAGRAALELGDAQAAAGFFARADDVNSRSPLPQAGMGAVSVLSGEPQAALPYFNRAEQLGATRVDPGCDRGLAYDLMGRQADAQSEYRAALTGPDGDEARRRLALSLAISGDRSEALSTLSPLVAKGDVAAGRARAFVLALAGDTNAAMVAINAAMPGSSASLAPFLQRLPSLQSGQKAAAANLGIFPDTGEARLRLRHRSAGDRQCDHEPAYRNRSAPPATGATTGAAAARISARASAGRVRGSGPEYNGGQACTGDAEDLAPACERLQRGRAQRSVSADEVEEQRPVRRHPGPYRQEPGSCALAGRTVPQQQRCRYFRRGSADGRRHRL